MVLHKDGERDKRPLKEGLPRCGQILGCGKLCPGVVPPYSPLSLESIARNES